MFSSLTILPLFLSLFLANSYLIMNILAQSPPPPPPPPPPPQLAGMHITILGYVYCDVCYDTTFSKHSYFLPGVDVNVECKVKARSARSVEEISLSVNRTTDGHGRYEVEVDDVDGPIVKFLCKATLVGGSPRACNARSISSTEEVRVRSNQWNGHTYILGALSYRPPRRNATLCSEFANSLNNTKFYLPPYQLPWPPFPQLPPFPSFPFPPTPPFPSFPFPPCPPSLPFPFFPFPSNPPALPFPFPYVPPPPPPPSPPSPVFNFWDPKTWFPHPPSP